MINCQIPIFSSPVLHPVEEQTEYLGKYYMDDLSIDHHDYKNKQDLINTFILTPILQETGIDCRLLYWWHTNQSFDFDNTQQYQHLAQNFYRFAHYNRIIPYTVMKDNCEMLQQKFAKYIDKVPTDFLRFSRDVQKTFGKLNNQVLKLDKSIFQTNQGYQNYNIATATGRPSNAFGGINLAALPPEKRVGVLPKQEKFVLFDYSSYHVFLIAQLLNYEFPTDDIHDYFMTKYKITDRDEAKKITFRQLYGGVEKKYKDIHFFEQVDKFCTSLFNQYNTNGHINSVIYHRPMTKKNLGDMNKYKLFNYLLQCYETERNIQVILDINKYLYKSKTSLSLYNYDGFLFDSEDGDISKLKEILEQDGFPVTIKQGPNFGDMNEYSR